MIVMVLAPFMFREKITAVKIMGFVAVVLGMFFVNGAGIFSHGRSWGLVCGMLSAVMYSLMVIFNKKAKDINGLENAMLQLISSCIVVCCFTVFTHTGSFLLPQESIIPILVLGALNTGVGCYLYFSSIQQLSAQSVSICGYLEPLVALVFSACFLSEDLTSIQFIGAAFILGGAAFGELYGRR